MKWTSRQYFLWLLDKQIFSNRNETFADKFRSQFTQNFFRTRYQATQNFNQTCHEAETTIVYNVLATMNRILIDHRPPKFEALQNIHSSYSEINTLVWKCIYNSWYFLNRYPILCIHAMNNINDIFTIGLPVKRIWSSLVVARKRNICIE